MIRKEDRQEDVAERTQCAEVIEIDGLLDKEVANISIFADKTPDLQGI